MYLDEDIMQCKEKLQEYYADLETLLVWLRDNGALDNMDGKDGFKRLSKSSFEWVQGDRAIELTEEETAAFDRLGLLFK